MTCIVAHRDGWMVADKRQIWGQYGRGPFEVLKIRRWHFSLVGFAGATDHIYGAITADDYDKDPADAVCRIMRDAKGDDEYTALVCKRGELGVISGHGVYHSLQANCLWWAIGSGMDAALGYLAGISRHAHKIGPEDAAEAIRFASEIDVGVGDGCHVEVLT